MSYNIMFSSGVWLNNKAFNLKEYCLNVQKRDKGRVVSNRGGYQSSPVDTKDPILQPFISYIEEQANQFNKEIWKCLTIFEIDNMWVNINNKGDSNIAHLHPRTHFSGVYYVDKPKDSGDIFFDRPDTDLISTYYSGMSYGSLTNANSESWFFNCKKDDLIIFPAFYKHRVEPSRSNKQRISISFNLSSNLQTYT